MQRLLVICSVCLLHAHASDLADCANSSQCDGDPSDLMQVLAKRSSAATGLFRVAPAEEANASEPTDIEQHIAKQIKSTEKEKDKQNRKQWPGTTVNDTKTNSTGEQTAPFVHAAYQGSLGKPVEVKVEIATASEIVSIYLLLFVPLLMGWVYYWQSSSVGLNTVEKQDALYQLLIQLSVGATSIGNVIANQSLCILTREPMALTFLQAMGLCLTGVVVSAGSVLCSKTKASRHALSGLCMWTPAAVAFCAYQLADHFLSNTSSISERTIVGNLGPVVGLMVEVSLPGLFAVQRGDAASITSKMALFSTVFGATIFVLQDPDFNWIGIETSSIWCLSHIIYRLLQRALLGQLEETPVSWMLAWDGFLLCIPSLFMSGDTIASLWNSWQLWVTNSQVLILLLLSTLSFAAGHYVTICCLKSCSATLTMVIGNIATTLCLVQGILFFGDRDFQQPLTVVGMLINLFGGLWYAMNQDTAGLNKEQEVKDTADDIVYLSQPEKVS
mmetsp:Transcript_60884/g.113861  ORF Transcript_60884/g.113861 Transcript_60884/m.113861 type:complete len:501 (-) Transcript_60884:84-1586(-)